MRIVPSRIAAAAIALCLAGAVIGCGSSDNEDFRVGINEGAYVDIGTVAYQVQISRVLNPKSAEDVSYLIGLPAATLPPGPGEQWFGVFVRAQNFGDKPQAIATKFRVVDTSAKPYDPIALDPMVNAFVYNPTEPLQPNVIYPNVNSAAGAGPVRQGALLLFKLSDSVYQNRPLVLEIYDPVSGKLAATVDLDL